MVRIGGLTYNSRTAGRGVGEPQTSRKFAAYPYIRPQYPPPSKGWGLPGPYNYPSPNHN